MLSDEEKARILEDERLRAEARATLSGKGILPFLNSPFGLWCISTLAVGSISLLFTQVSSYTARRSAETARVVLLSNEVGSRAYQVLRFGSNTPAAVLYDSLFRPPAEIPSVYSFYPEFEQRPLMSLVEELKQLEEGSGTAEELVLQAEKDMWTSYQELANEDATGGLSSASALLSNMNRLRRVANGLDPDPPR